MDAKGCKQRREEWERETDELKGKRKIGKWRREDRLLGKHEGTGIGERRKRGTLNKIKK